MNFYHRLLALLLVLLPLVLTACMERTEFEVRRVRVVKGKGADQDDQPLKDDPDGQREADPDELIEEELPAIDPGEYTYREVTGSAEPLVVDPSAPTLKVLSLERREGIDGHYLSFECDDPTEEQDYDFRGGRWQYGSVACDVALSTALQAIQITPAVDLRVAPTPFGLRIIGDFEQGDYEITIKAGLRTEKGATLKEDFNQSFDVPPLSPAIELAAQGRFLPRKAWPELQLRHRNIDQVTAELRHIPHQNMAFWLADGQEAVDQRTSQKVLEFTFPVTNEEDQTLTSHLPLQDYLPEPEPGLYQILLRDNDTLTKSLLQVSDINLLAKKQETKEGQPWPEGFHVWALQMEDTEPIFAAQIEAIRPNGQVMARCTTSRDGHCRLDLPKDDVDETPPMALVAKKGPDLTYLKFEDLRTELPEGDTSGPSFLEHTAYRAAVYGDRDLYRPGDQVHLIGALRNDDYSAADPQIPVSITVFDPQNKVVLTEQTRTDHLGLLELSFPLNELAPTGRWRAQFEVGDRRLKTYSFHVEEFVPERMEVSAEARSPRLVAGQRADFEVQARYLFGASAQGSEVEARCRLIPQRPRQEGGFHFGPLDLEQERRPLDLPTVHSLIGEDDQTQISCPTGQENFTGPTVLEANIAVFEAGSGRATRAWAATELHPAPYQIGLKSNREELAEGDRFTLEGVIHDLNGELASQIDQEITLEIYDLRRQYSYQYDPQQGHYTYVSNLQFLLQRVLQIEPQDGRFAFEATASEISDGYLVRAKLGRATSEIHLGRSGQGWLWQGQQDHTPRPLRPTSVLIEAPKSAPLNSPTQVGFIAPFAGRALMTVETDRVIHQEWIQATEGQNIWEFTAIEFVPNVYISAFILGDPRSKQDGSFTPQRAFGAASIALERDHLEISAELAAPEEVRPKDILEVKLTAKDLQGPARATIAAVDEGILQLTNFASPDPLKDLLIKRGLGVETFDTIGWATQLPPSGPSSKTGGDADYADDTGGRIMPFQPVSLWSGLIDLDEDGEAKVEFELPNYRGRLRIMAVVATKERMGQAEAEILVRDPLTLQATFPRFLTVGDEVQIPLFVSNLTGQDRQATITIDAQEFDLPGFDIAPDEASQPILDIIGASSQQIELKAGQSKTLHFTARSIRPGGAAKIIARAESGDLSSSEEWTIPLRPGGPKERISQVITLDKTEEIDLGPLLTGWVPTSEETTLWISAMPQPESFDHLEYLIRYPYGCTEQILSQTRPMLFVSDLMEAVDPAAVSEKGGLRAMVESGIQRILAVQKSSGAFSYWPGEQQVSAWVSAYALHFLMDAADQGYAVPQARIDSAIKWLKNNTTSDRGDAYIHYVLALAGEGQRSKVERAIKELPKNPQGQQAEDAYLLYAALYLTGDRSFEEELKDPSIALSGGGRTSDFGFYSHRRHRALRLNIFADLFGHLPEGQPLADAVADQLTDQDQPRYYTTQEVMWGVTGLGKWYRQGDGDGSNISLLVGGKPLRPGRQVQDLPGWSMARASELKDLTLKVERPQDAPPLYALLTSEGVRQDPNIRIGGEGLEVERTYLRSNGQAVRHGEVNLGDLLYVRLRISNGTYETLRHVALADYLPAGLEVENTDLGAAPLPDWATDKWETDHRNARDDRMEFFGTLKPFETTEVIYPVRATLAGKFHAPTVEVEAMYQPEYWARAPQQDILITAPWQDLVD